jgi:uracil-DNA glycosylase
MLIAPRPVDGDLAHGLPLTSDAGQQLHGLMKAHAGIDTEADCFVFPGSVLPKKQSKLVVEPFKSLPLNFHHRFKMIVCVGGDNFKFFFGEGKKSSLQTLANGNLIFLPSVIGNTPLFVIPDIDMLSPDWDNIPEEEHWKVESVRERAVKWLVRILPLLGNHYHKIK